MAEQLITLNTTTEGIALCGSYDRNLEILKKEYGVDLVLRGCDLKVIGDEGPVTLCAKTIRALLPLITQGKDVDELNVRYAISLTNEGSEQELQTLSGSAICITQKGKPVHPKTVGQKRYIKTIEQNTVTLGIGPAGTGKTYLAVAMAVNAFRSGAVNRIILTRPAVEAGEKLGFLPGDLQNKVDPYLRPLYDALYDFLGSENFHALSERGVIEVAPLAYMRGRTLNDAYIILDEAQNCTVEQMKMFLTRFGEGSRVVVTGDITQIDLPRDKKSGLVHALDVLEGVDGIARVFLTYKDVVRHEMVQKIITAYDKYEHRSRD